MSLESKVKVNYSCLNRCITARNVHILHNDCLWCVDYNEGIAWSHLSMFWALFDLGLGYGKAILAFFV